MMGIFFVTYFNDNFMSAFAVEFISTKEIGNIPILEPNFPSAQFSSTLLNTVKVSP